MSLLVKYMTVVIAIAIAYILYTTVIEMFLSDQCLIDTNTCLQLRYYNFENSVLVQMLPAGYWIYFNGKYGYIYETLTSSYVCDEGYEPVYRMDPTTGLPHELECVESLQNIIEFYRKKNIKPKTLFKRMPMDQMGSKSNSTLKNYQQPKVLKANAYDVLNLLQEKNIINLKDINK